MSDSPFFPLARFSSLTAVHSTLLLFAALYLPRSSFLVAPLPPQASSRDKPQHPFLLPLTADPLLTLLWLCIGAALVQASWANWLRNENEQSRLLKLGDDEEAKMEHKLESGKAKLQDLKNAVVATLVSSLFIHVVLVLFGAHFVDHFSKTYFLALLISLLSVFPTVYTLKPPSLASDSNALVHRLLWLRLFAEFKPRTSSERFLTYPAIATIAGAWLGAFPIPLDWDRPWQAWPLTPAYGAILGNVLGLWTALSVNAVMYLAELDKTAIAEAEKATSETAKASSKTSSKKKSHKK